MNRSPLRCLIAITALLTSLLVSTPPAAAIPTTYWAEITGGTFTFTKTGVTETIDLNPFFPSCTTPSTLTIYFTSNSSSSTVLVTGFNWSHQENFGIGSYLAVIDLSPFAWGISGHLTSNTFGKVVTSMRVPLRLRIYNTTGCIPVEPPICQLGWLAHMSGTSTDVSTSNALSFNGSGVGNVVAYPQCTMGPSYLLGTTSQLSGLGLHTG